MADLETKTTANGVTKADEAAPVAAAAGGGNEGAAAAVDYADLLAGVTPEQLAAARDTAALEADLSEKELRKLGQMREKMADEPVTAADTATLIRYLRARDWKTTKAEPMLRATLAWRREYLPKVAATREALPENVQAELAKNKLFWRGHDVDGRQLFHVRAYLFDPKTRDLDACMQALVFLLEQGRRAKLHPLEKVVCVWDQTGFGFKQIDYQYIKQFLNVLQNHYPEGLYACVLYPIGWLFWASWKVTKYFLAEETKKKLCFLKEGEEDQILAYIDRDNLLVELGGNVEHETPACRKGPYPVIKAKAADADADAPAAAAAAETK